MRLLENPDSVAPWDLVVLDHFRSGFKFYNQLSQWGPVFSLDEGGPAREKADFLIDSLPLPRRMKAPNLFDISLLDLPFTENRAGEMSLLVAFGGTGNRKLTSRFLKLLPNLEIPENCRITILGNREDYNRFIIPEIIEFIPFIDDLKSKLNNYSHVITYFGITAFEAVSSGCRVILMNPGAYHEKLSDIAGFFSINKSNTILQKFFTDQSWTNPALEKPDLSFWERIKQKKPESPVCPLCRSRQRKIIDRAGEKSFFKCLECGMEYLYRPLGDPVDYGKDYFFDDYQKQYGKSYLDDFKNIYNNCRDRVKLMNSLICKRDRTLLDIGCAFGPFLKASADNGWLPSGIDISEEAVHYVKKNFPFPVGKGDFVQIDIDSLPGKSVYDAVTLWYVIEHFINLDQLLRKINIILNPDGILAFSTPNASGGTRLFHRKRFFRESPDDHFSLWRPSAVRSWLYRYGFKLKKIRITGHHPERISPFFSHKLTMPMGLLISRLFGWGDTFEVYAVKIRGRKQ